MASLSTHVLDSSAGGPRAGVEVTVTGEDGTVIARAPTGPDGRVAELASGLPIGAYRLTWATAGALITEVTVTVHLGADRHYHVPLLASDVAAVTYLGV